MNEIIIRKAEIADAEALSVVCSTSFYQTYSWYNTEANMQLFINVHFTPERIREDLEKGNGITFLVFVNVELAGYVKLGSRKQPAMLPEGRALEVERLYVLETWQGYRLGFKLMNHSIAYAREQGFEVLWLGVWERNLKAIAFYERLGLIRAGEHDFLLGEDVQRDYIYYKRLK